MHIYGAHISHYPNELSDEVDRINNIGANLVQLFVDPLFKDQTVYSNLKKKLKNMNMFSVVHASYTINLANNWDEYSFWITQFISEIVLADKVGSFGIVIHMGKRLDLPKEIAYNNMYSSLLHIHNKTKKNSNVKIFLETPCGQGSEICYKIEDFAYFFKKFSLNRNKDVQDRFRLCIDTAHIWAAGYNISTIPTINIYLDSFEELIGIKYIGLIHLNDSKRELGSNVDRHENIGKGYIGENGLKYFSEFFKKYNVPIVLETPYNLHEQEIKKYLK